MDENNVLVVGSHRSGSTWVGNVISKASKRHYIHEPFNPNVRPWIIQNPRPRWYDRLSEDDEWWDEYRRMLAYGFRFRYPVAWLSKPKKVARFMIEQSQSLEAKIYDQARVVKDPIALMSADVLYKLFGFRVVCLIRHPGAFVNSLIKANWRFPYDDVLRQDDLMRLIPRDISDDFVRYDARQPSLLEEAATLWNLFHFWISELQSKYPEWHFVTHESLSLAPFDGFRAILEYCGGYDEDRLRSILSAGAGSNKREATKPNDIRIDSKQNLGRWRKRLSDSQIDIIRDKTRRYWHVWFDETDW